MQLLDLDGSGSADWHASADWKLQAGPCKSRPQLVASHVGAALVGALLGALLLGGDTARQPADEPAAQPVGDANPLTTNAQKFGIGAKQPMNLGGSQAWGEAVGPATPAMPVGDQNSLTTNPSKVRDLAKTMLESEDPGAMVRGAIRIVTGHISEDISDFVSTKYKFYKILMNF